MKFTIDRITDRQIKPCKKAQPYSYIPYNTNKKEKTISQSREVLAWKIELKSLCNLIELQREVKHSLIIKNIDGRNHITINDDNIE